MLFDIVDLNRFFLFDGGDSGASFLLGGERISFLLRFGACLLDLRDLLGLDLRTLALVNGGGGALGLPPALAHVRAPRLRELTVVDPSGQLRFAPADEEEGEVGEKGPPRFPRLERLNVLGGEGVLGLRRWARMAPRLTHLRISHLREAVAAVLGDQTDLLATVAPAEWARTSGWRGPRLRSLRMVRGVEA